MKNLQVETKPIDGLRFLRAELDRGYYPTPLEVSDSRLRALVPSPVDYHQVATVSYQGTVIAFARGTPASVSRRRRTLSDHLLTSDLYFNVLALNPDDDSNAKDWTGFQPVGFPNAVRPAGMQIVNVPAVYDKTSNIPQLQDAGLPIRAKASADYLYLFRQSVESSLLVNRFRLTRKSDGKSVTYVLEPAWEVRFQRSGKPDTPADSKDVLNYLSADNEPFVEPTLELFMLKGGKEADFDVEFLPVSSGGLSCQVFEVDHVKNQIDLYNIPLDPNGAFLLTGKKFDGNRILPDRTFSITNKEGKAITLNGAPSAVYYQKQERVLDASSNSYLVKRTGRLMLTLNGSLPASEPDGSLVRSDGEPTNTLVTVDFSVAVDGTLATPAPELHAAAVGPANYAIEFGDLGYVRFADIVFQSKFAVEFWIYPKSKDSPNQRILGNSDKPDAPDVSLVNGTQIEVGFTGKNGQKLVCLTASGAVLQENWSHVVITFDETVTPKFQIHINRSQIHSTITGNGDIPNGTAVNQVSSATAGFIGDLDDLRLYQEPTALHLIAEWSFDTINYADDPPTTPNSKVPENPGKVFGAYLVPSTSPASAGNSGTISFDERNLTIYTAYFKDFSQYGELRSSPYLLAGSDGLIHCYFQGKDNRFSVLQLNTESARALFAAPWTASDPIEKGTVQFVAGQSGDFMNEATIVTKSLTDPALNRFFCNVEISSKSGRKENWLGVPRSLLPFVATLNGQFKGDPGDPRLANGAKVYYDVLGSRAAAYVPLDLNSSAGQMAFVTRYPDRLPLSSLKIDEILPDTVTVTLEFKTPRWADAKMTQVWKWVPADVQKLLATLDGLEPGYQYKDPVYCNINSYSLVAISDFTSSNRLILWTNPSVSELVKLQITDGPKPNLCHVAITLVSEGKELSATWQDVERQQVAFSRTLEYDYRDHYDYEAHTTGDYQALGALLTITTNGMNAAVSNRSAEKVEPDGDMLAGASLFGAFATAPVVPSEKVVSPVGPIPATEFQSAYYEQAGKKFYLNNGSQLFAAMPGSLPHQGGVGIVQDTVDLTGGRAYLIQQGVTGGWINSPAKRTLAFTGSNRVSFSTNESQAPNISELTILGDLSLELWCKPQRARSDSKSPNQRLLTFNRNSQANQSDTAVRYLAGLRDCPCLNFRKDNTIRAAAETSEGTFYTWFSLENVTTGVVGSISTLLLNDPVLTVSLDTSQKLQVVFSMDASQTPISSKGKIDANIWYQVAVTFVYAKENSDWIVDTALYLNGEVQGTAKYKDPTKGDLSLGTFVLGDIANQENSLPMYLNEAAFFSIPLSPDFIRQYSEERIPDNSPKMMFKWMFIDKNARDVAVNSSATGIKFSPPILPQAVWADRGLYFRPILGYGENIGTVLDQPIIAGWSHLALVHQAGYALKLNGSQYADCGNSDSLTLGRQGAIEAWIQLNQEARLPSQTVLAKGADYRLWITNDFKPVFQLQIVSGGVQETVVITGPNKIDVTVAHYLAVNYQVVNVKKAEGQGNLPEYELHIDLYLDSQLIARGVLDPKDQSHYRRFKDSPEIVSSTSNLNLGRTPEFNGSGYLDGYISDVRIWSRNLTTSEILSVYSSHRAPTKRDGLISYWRFNDGSGKTAFDAQGNNNAKLSDGDLMVNFKPTAANWFYVNGESSEMIQFADSTSSVGGYGSEEQFHLCYVNASRPIGFYGDIDEVRIWDQQLTREQITDNMNRPLSGNESNLMGLWGFENGSGSSLVDNTGRANTGRLIAGDGGAPPKWLDSTAPLNNESSVVYNILGGVPTFELRRIDERPAVIDYADVERDAYGGIFSVMKRGYFFVDSGELQLVTGYKVGDLDTVYIGQVQTKPTIVGFIEGGPPLPSENQTKPFWKGTLSEYNSYDNAGSVEFEEATETTYVFGADRDYSESDELGMKGGLFLGGQYGTAEGIGFEVEQRVAVFEGRLGDQNKILSETHSKPGSENRFGTSRTMGVAMEPGGSWETGKDPKMWLNPTIGRRYIPSNVGCAIVKSLTADLYASKLRSTGMMVKLTAVPNPDIPEDVNIINFPINPKYIKNGTLDGKVGLKTDPDVDPRAPSYFRPVEAYAIKRKVERQEKQLEAYYLQFAADRYASQLINKSAWEDYQKTVMDTPAYNWAKHLSKRNIVNTYVWTAAGGSYAEQVSTMNVYSETYGAIGSLSAGLGLVADLKVAVPVAGPFFEIDYIHNWKAEVNVVRSKEQSAEFSLTADASPDGFLSSPVFEADGTIDFPEAPTEGKVDAYRYMAFFLGPDAENFKELKSSIIDPLWLNQGMDQAAVALREATEVENGAWRVLFRVTYVSRIPPSFQPAPAQAIAPDVQKPVNIDANTLIVQLVKGQIGSDKPTSLQIGAAVTKVLGAPPDNLGVLNNVLPWWGTFLTDSQNYQLPAGQILRQLREDLLKYITDDYAAENPS